MMGHLLEKCLEIMTAASPMLGAILLSVFCVFSVYGFKGEGVPPRVSVALALAAGASSVYIWGLSQLWRSKSLKSFPEPDKRRPPVKYEARGFQIFFLVYLVLFVSCCALNASDDDYWRAIAILAAIAYVIPSLLVFFLPESSNKLEPYLPPNSHGSQVAENGP